MNCKTKTNFYKCTECDKNFNNQRHYKRHIDGHKNNNCTHCNEKFTHRKHLKNHMLYTHNIRENACFQCTECNAKFVKRITLILHITKKHADGKYPCNECAAMFETIHERNLHLEEHNKQKPFTCERCGSKFYRKQQYLVHMKQHDKYKCITCNENYADKKSLLKHKGMGHKIQGIEQQYKCDLCLKTLSSKILLNVHLRKHKKNQTENVSQSNKLKKDITDNDDIQPENPIKNPSDFNKNVIQYFCPICKKMFEKKSRLNQHKERVHSKNEYNCGLCSHQSNNKTNLIQHMRLHLTHEREFICDQCGKSFYRNSTLKEHKILLHNEQCQQFSCEICGKSIKRNISRHLQTHSEERPYNCLECGQSYKRKTHLQRHQLTSHGVTSNPNKRLVQRLVKNSNGDFIPLKQSKENASPVETKTKDVITSNSASVVDIRNISVYSFNCEELIETYENSELWIDDKSNNIVVDYSNTMNNQQTTEQYLNQTNLHLDHIDTKDLIVLSTEQMLTVNAVVDNSNNKDILPDYLPTFQYL